MKKWITDWFRSLADLLASFDARWVLFSPPVGSSEEFSNGYDACFDAYCDGRGSPSHLRAVAERDPNPSEFNKGWILACEDLKREFKDEARKV